RGETMKDFEQHTLFPYTRIIDRPAVKWPGGARVAFWIVPNIEHFHLELGPGAPDVRNHARRDYGNRVGVWRVMETLAKHGMRGTVALNSEVVQHYPRVMEECGKLGWELMGHGMTNSSLLAGLSPEQEAGVIAAARDAVESCGQKMR